GHNWENDYHVLNRRKLIADFKNLKDLGIHTIKYQGGSIYDHNVLEASKICSLTVSYSFWIPENIDFMVDTLRTGDLKSNILKSIRELQNSDHIISWHIENDGQYNQNNYYHKPSLLYQNRAYLLWLKDLVTEIKKIDHKRSLIVDVEVNQHSVFHIKKIQSNIKNIDAIGLQVKEDEYLNEVTAYLKHINKQYILSGIDSDLLKEHGNVDDKTSFFITSWQDKHESNKLDFDGIIDRKGRYKQSYITLASQLNHTDEEVELPKVKILKPAKLIFDDNTYTFHAMVNQDDKGWQSASKIKDLKFEWSLVKCDAHGNYLAIKVIGENAKISLKIPKDHNYYRLHLAVIDGDYISTDISRFHTPLIGHTQE